MMTQTTIRLSKIALMLAIAKLATGGAVGCLSLPDEEVPPRGRTDNSPPAVVSGTDAGVSSTPEDPNAGAPPELELDTIPESTTHESFAVSGRGPAEGSVVIEVNGRLFTQGVGASGTFCRVVSLDAGQVNQIKVQALDKNGVYSEEILATVTQIPSTDAPESDSAPTPPVEEQPSENVLLGLSPLEARTNVSCDGDNWTAMTDGSQGTYAVLSNAVFGGDYMSYQLSERTGIGRIVVQSTSNCVLESFIVLVSDAADPGRPLPYVETYPGEEVPEFQWNPVLSVSDGGMTVDREFEPVVARHVAIVFLEAGCSSWGVGEHRLREVQAWSAPVEFTTPTNPEAPSGPRCPGQ